jgi:hypothetical protein
MKTSAGAPAGLAGVLPRPGLKRGRSESLATPFS